MPLKNSCSIHARCSKSSLKHFIRFCGIFPSLKHNFIAYRSSKVSDCIFESHQLWQSGFSRMYSYPCCSYSFEPEIIKISQSFYKMDSNNLVNFQESTTILNAHTKKSFENYWMYHVHIQIHMQYTYRRTLLFLVRTILLTSWLQFFNARRKTPFLKVFRNHTMLTPPSTFDRSRGV